MATGVRILLINLIFRGLSECGAVTDQLGWASNKFHSYSFPSRDYGQRTACLSPMWGMETFYSLKLLHRTDCQSHHVLCQYKVGHIIHTRDIVL